MASAAGHTLDYQTIDTNLASPLRCLDLGTDDMIGVSVTNSGADGYATAASLSTYSGGYDTAGTNQADTAATGAVDAGTCNSVAKPHCVRFTITFVNTPGDLTALSVDTSGVTVKNQDSNVWENTAEGAIGVGSSVTDSVTAATAITGTDVTVIIEAKEEVVCADDDCEIDAAVDARKLWFDLQASGNDPATKFTSHDRIRIRCGTKEIGTYTVDAVQADGTYLTTLEDMPTCSGDEDITNAQYTNEVITVNLVSDFIWVNADLRDVIAASDNYYVKSAGDSEIFGPVTAVYWEIETDKGHPTDTHGRLFLGNPVAGSAGSITGDLKISGAGTTEKSECSDRGVCEPEDGLCKCFSGYTGLACSTQRAISA